MEGLQDGLPQPDVHVQHPLKIFDLAKSQGKFVYACAPMVRYSKLAFRQTVHEYGTDLCWTPMILAKEFNRSSVARHSDFTISTHASQPPTIVQFGANTPHELARAASLVAPYAAGIDLNCGCPQTWACADTLGAALMDERARVLNLVLATRARLHDDGWAVGMGADDVESPRGRSVSVKIRVHKDLRRTVDFLDTVLGGEDRSRNVDFLTIHPRTRGTPSTTPVNLEALAFLTEKYGDRVPILVSGDVFSMSTLPYTSPYLAPREGDAERPHLPKLRGLMAARALLANPALFAGYEACPWEAVGRFMNRVVRAPLPLKLVQHHLSEMCSPGFGRSKVALLSKAERAEMHGCKDMCDLIDFVDEKIKGVDGRDGLRRDLRPA